MSFFFGKRENECKAEVERSRIQSDEAVHIKKLELDHDLTKLKQLQDHELAQLAETSRLAEMTLESDRKDKELESQAQAQRLQFELSIKQEESRLQREKEHQNKSHELMMKMLEMGFSPQEFALASLCASNTLKLESSKETLRQQQLLAQQITHQSGSLMRIKGQRKELESPAMNYGEFEDSNSEPEENRVVSED